MAISTGCLNFTDENDEVLISGFGRKGKAKGDIPGVRLYVGELSALSLAHQHSPFTARSSRSLVLVFLRSGRRRRYDHRLIILSYAHILFHYRKSPGHRSGLGAFCTSLCECHSSFAQTLNTSPCNPWMVLSCDTQTVQITYRSHSLMLQTMATREFETVLTHERVQVLAGLRCGCRNEPEKRWAVLQAMTGNRCYE